MMYVKITGTTGYKDGDFETSIMFIDNTPEYEIADQAYRFAIKFARRFALLHFEEAERIYSSGEKFAEYFDNLSYEYKIISERDFYGEE